MTDHKKNAKAGSRSHLAAKFKNAANVSVLPPIGVFWDIENCQVPRNRSATALVHNIREQLFKGHREAEFMCVCDISKENREVIHELNMAQVTVVHVNAISKNAADDKLKQCMRRFVDIHGSPSTVVLISADVNFSTDLSDFRHRRNVTVYLIHSDHAPEPLLACAHKHFRFEDLISSLPFRSPMKGQLNQPCELLITNLPSQTNPKPIQNRLKQLSDNCGGRVLNILDSTAVLRFPNHEAAQRAKKRMDKEDVYGHKINVDFSPRSCSPHRPHKSRSGNRSNPESGSSRDASPLPLSSESSQSSGSFPAVLDSDAHASDYTFSAPVPTHSESFLVTSECKEDEDLSERFEASRQSHARISCSSPVMPVQQKGLLENKVIKTPQKNIGRVSPFMKMETPNKLSPRDHLSRVNRDFSPELFGGGSSGSFHSASAPRLDYRLFPQSDFSTYGDLLPIRSSPTFGGVSSAPVELLVTNLDQSIEANEMKKILLAAFREHVMVLHISMLLQSDGSLKAVVKVPSIQDAQFAVSQLHRRKIGSKRILISYISNDRVVPLHILKAEVLALLADIPSRKLPLFKFRELFENRYHRPIGIPELYKLQEVILITEDAMGRMVCLNPDYRATPSPADMDGSGVYSDLAEKSYCERHFQLPESQGWAELDSVYPLPDVSMSLTTLSSHVHTLLDTHQGCVPLNSFCACYKAEFGPLPVVQTDRAGPSHEIKPCSVPLEHLIACIPGVQIAHSSLGIKKIQWLENNAVQQQSNRCISPALVGQMLLFGKEMVDLLKSQPQCSIPFSKFVPTYHHHFGRQCRVADYGFTKLIDLLEAIPHVVQILGQGQNRMLTLTHRCQVKRFASDLMRVLKSVASKQVLLSEFPHLYEQCLDRPLDIGHYGVCFITDMLTEVSDHVVVTTRNMDTVISIPKREQTSEEIELTKDFSRDVLELLRHSPKCSMSFNKFIPSYHHHFGRQCRVANYGFTKLIELFEAIPSIVDVLGTGENKIIKLTQDERLKVLAERIKVVVQQSPQEQIRLDLLSKEYSRIHGHSIHLEDFDSNSLHQLLAKMKQYFKLKQTVIGTVIFLVDCDKVHEIHQQIHQLLMELPQGEMTLEALSALYLERFRVPFDPTVLKNMNDDVKIEGVLVKLSKKKLLARNIVLLLRENGGQLPVQNFESAYMNRFGVPCRPAEFGCTTIVALLNSFPEYLLVRGRRGKKAVNLNFETTDFLLPSGTSRSKTKLPVPKMSPVVGNEDCASDPELMTNVSSLDLLSQPIPSNVPSPDIKPEFRPFKERDLMGFESPMVSQRELICDLNEQERRLLHSTPLLFTARATESSPSLTTSQTPYCPRPVSISRVNPRYLDSSYSTDTSAESLSEAGTPSRSSIRNRNRIAAQFPQSPN